MTFDPLGGIVPTILGRMDEEYESAIDEAADLEQRRYELREQLYDDAMKATGDFWPLAMGDAPRWGDEQELRVMFAVRNAIRDKSLTDSERYHLILSAVVVESMEYAHRRSQLDIER